MIRELAKNLQRQQFHTPTLYRDIQFNCCSEQDISVLINKQSVVAIESAEVKNRHQSHQFDLGLHIATIFNLVVAFIYSVSVKTACSFSGFKYTASATSQFRVLPLHRSGCLALAYTAFSWRTISLPIPACRRVCVYRQMFCDNVNKTYLQILRQFAML